jgi:hypothetical protein
MDSRAAVSPSTALRNSDTSPRNRSNASAGSSLAHGYPRGRRPLSSPTGSAITANPLPSVNWRVKSPRPMLAAAVHADLKPQLATTAAQDRFHLGIALKAFRHARHFLARLLAARHVAGAIKPVAILAEAPASVPRTDRRAKQDRRARALLPPSPRSSGHCAPPPLRAAIRDRAGSPMPSYRREAPGLIVVERLDRALERDLLMLQHRPTRCPRLQHRLGRTRGRARQRARSAVLAAIGRARAKASPARSSFNRRTCRAAASVRQRACARSAG